MNRLSSFVCCGLLLISISASSQQVHTQSSRTLSFQGLLQSTNDNVRITGDREITVHFYTDAAGTQEVWRDTYATHILQGVFSLELGSGTVPLPGSDVMSHSLWLGIQIGGDEVLRPLTSLSASPVALSVSDNSITKENMATDFVGSIAINGQTVSSKGGTVNFVTGDGIDASLDPVKNTIVLKASASSLQKGASSQSSDNYILNQTTQESNANFNISGSGTIGSTLNVSGNTALGGTLAVSGASTTTGVTNTGNITNSGAVSTGTLAVSGASTTTGVTNTGNITNSGAVSTGTLAVSGASTTTGVTNTGNITNSGAVSTGTLAVSGASTTTGVTNTGNITNSGAVSTGTLAVSGASTTTGVTNTGNITNSGAVSTGTLAVSGASTTTGVTNTGNITNSGAVSTGTLTVSGASTTNGITNGGNLSVAGTSTLVGNTEIDGVLTLDGLTHLPLPISGIIAVDASNHIGYRTPAEIFTTAAGNWILNQNSAPQLANFQIGGSGAIGTTLTVGGASTFHGLLAMNGNPITTVANPTNPQDAATKSYVDNETSRAQGAEATITTSLAGEVARAQAAEATNAAAISSETTRATGAESTLTTNLASEVTRAGNAEAANASAITTETTRAQGAESTLTTNLASEVTRAGNAETANAAAITTETTRAQGAESTLTTNLASEVTRASNAEAANASAITTETARAMSAESTNATAISTEATRAQAAEATNAAAVSAEAVARTTAVNNEAAARTAADNTLQGNINTEASTRATAVTSAIATAENYTDNAVATEVTDRNAAIATSAASTLGSANAYTDAAVATGDAQTLSSANTYTDNAIAGSAANYIANSTNQQSSANFNIDGNGTMGSATVSSLSNYGLVYADASSQLTNDNALIWDYNNTRLNITVPPQNYGTGMALWGASPGISFGNFGAGALGWAGWSQDAGSNDMVLRSANGANLLLQSGTSHAGIVLDAGNNTNIKQTIYSDGWSVTNDGTASFAFVSGDGSALTNITAANLNGTLSVPNGGTGVTSLNTNEVLLGNGSSEITSVPAGSEGQVLSINGGVPTWQSLSGNFIQNGTAQQTNANFNIDGNGVVGNDFEVDGYATLNQNVQMFDGFNAMGNVTINSSGGGSFHVGSMFGSNNVSVQSGGAPIGIGDQSVGTVNIGNWSGGVNLTGFTVMNDAQADNFFANSANFSQLNTQELQVFDQLHNYGDVTIDGALNVGGMTTTQGSVYVMNNASTYPGDAQPSALRATAGVGDGGWYGLSGFGGYNNTAVAGELFGNATIGGHNASLSTWSDLYINPGPGNIYMGYSGYMTNIAGFLEADNGANFNFAAMASGFIGNANINDASIGNANIDNANIANANVSYLNIDQETVNNLDASNLITIGTQMPDPYFPSPDTRLRLRGTYGNSDTYDYGVASNGDLGYVESYYDQYGFYLDDDNNNGAGVSFTINHGSPHDGSPIQILGLDGWGNLAVPGAMSASAFSGDGSNLSNISEWQIPNLLYDLASKEDAANVTNDARAAFSAGTGIDITDGVISATGSGGNTFINNSGDQQAAANFNIDGSGTIGQELLVNGPATLNNQLFVNGLAVMQQLIVNGQADINTYSNSNTTIGGSNVSIEGFNGIGIGDQNSAAIAIGNPYQGGPIDIESANAINIGGQGYNFVPITIGSANQSGTVDLESQNTISIGEQGYANTTIGNPYQGGNVNIQSAYYNNIAIGDPYQGGSVRIESPNSINIGEDGFYSSSVNLGNFQGQVNIGAGAINVSNDFINMNGSIDVQGPANFSDQVVMNGQLILQSEVGGDLHFEPYYNHTITVDPNYWGNSQLSIIGADGIGTLSGYGGSMAIQGGNADVPTSGQGGFVTISGGNGGAYGGQPGYVHISSGSGSNPPAGDVTIDAGTITVGSQASGSTVNFNAGVSQSYIAPSNSYYVQTSDYYVNMGSSPSSTVFLPVSSNPGRTLVIIDESQSTTINSQSGPINYNGGSSGSFALSGVSSVTLVSDGTQWFVTATY